MLHLKPSDITGIDKEKYLQYSDALAKDGFSFPNKVGFGFIDQLNVYFIPEYSNTWTNNRRYDFYFELNDKKYFMEMDGWFHFNDNKMSGMTKEEVHAIDVEKNKLAEDNGVHMIRIDCSTSTMEHIKKSILHSELKDLFDLSVVDWIKCEEYAVNSILIKVCELWKEHCSVSQICEMIKCNRSTVWRYVNRGKELNLCDYDPTIARQIICVNTKEIFDNGRDAAKKYNIAIVGNITANCKGRANSAGKHPVTGESLVWMFYDEYLELSEEEQNKPITKTIKTCNTSGVICLNTLEVFKKATQAAKKYNISPGNITVNAQGKINYAGTLPDGTPLRWMYRDEYLAKQLGA